MKIIHTMVAIATLDLKMWQRMPQAILTALIPPLGMALLLVVLSYNATQQPVALVVQGSGPYAIKMKNLISADTDTYALRLTDAAGAASLLKQQAVAAIITIPSDFDADVDRHSAKLFLTLNNVDIDFGDDIRRSVNRSVAQFDAPELGQDGELDPNDTYMSSVNPYNVSIDEDDLRQTNVDFIHYQVLPVLVLLVLSVGLIGTALLCASDTERGTAKVLLLYPVDPIVLIAGRLLGGVLACSIVLIPSVLLCLVTKVITPPPGHWPVLCAIFLATAIAASGMGCILGTVVRGSKNIAMASSVLATYLFFLGGGFTTIAFLPDWLREISTFNPFRYAIDGMRQSLFYPDLSGLPMDVTVLSATAVVCLVLGALVVRRSWAQ